MAGTGDTYQCCRRGCRGEEELESSILNDALVVVDDLRQAIHAGEINVPISRGLLKKDQIYAELGEIITQKKGEPITG